MKEFDAWSILTHCSPVLDGTKRVTHDKSNIDHWIAPRMHCSWDRGFYFQPFVIEFDFGKYMPHHAAKRSFVFVRNNANEFKSFKDAETGVVNRLPVIAFYIFINKRIFPERDGQNEIEWLNALTPRTTAIAHELVIADQYATRFNPANNAGFSVTIPTLGQEEELMCPSFEVESLLHEIEFRFGVKLGTVAEFIAQQDTTAMQSYYHAWLKKHAVEDNLCRNRTHAYLTANIRSTHQHIEGVLEETKSKHGFSSLSESDLMKHMHNNSGFAKEFVNGLVQGGCITGFQSLHQACCVGSKQDIQTHKCAAEFHKAGGGGCSAVRCDFIRHTKILIHRRDKGAKR